MDFFGRPERAARVKGNDVALKHTTPFNGLLGPSQA